MQNAMLFVGYGFGERLSGVTGGNSLAPVFLGGCAGGFVQSFVVAPAELLKAFHLLSVSFLLGHSLCSEASFVYASE